MKALRWTALAVSVACIGWPEARPLLAGGEPQSFARASPAEVGLAAAPLQQATALLKQSVTDQKIAGAVAAVARRGKLVSLESVGVQDLKTRAPMTEQSLFRIYSMTK